MAKCTSTIEQDVQLVAQILNGDKNAFEQMFEQNHRQIFSLCVKITQNTELAEDICQETFIQAWRKISQYKGDARLSTWLHRIAVNQFGMHLRKRYSKLEKLSIEDEEVHTMVEDITQQPYKHIILNPEIWDAIDQLPDGYRNCFVLKEIEGFEHTEIARILGCTVGTSKSQLHKAKLKMQKLINKKVNPTCIPALQPA